MLWALGVNRTLEEGKSPDDGLAVSKNMRNTTFEGMMGPVAVDEKGDGKPNYMINMIQNKTLVPLLVWIAAEKKMLQLYKAEDPTDWTGLLWPGGMNKVPSGSPQCGWKGELCEVPEDNDFEIIFPSLALFLLMIFALMVAIGFHRMR